MTALHDERAIYVSYLQRGDNYEYDKSNSSVEERRPLYPNEVWLDLAIIPAVSPAQSPFPGTGSIQLTPAGVSVVNGISNVSMTQVVGSPYRLHSAAGQFSNCVPANYSGNVYRPTLRDANGKNVPYDPSVWVMDGVQSVIEFKYRTPTELGYTLPLILNYWQYNGRIASAGGVAPVTPQLWQNGADPNLGTQRVVTLNPAFPGYTIGDTIVFPQSSTENTVPVSQIKFFLDGSSGAVRGGRVTGNAWNVANRGAQSVAFGQDNLATAAHSTASGGLINEASAVQATVGGGTNNKARAFQSTIGGGASNWIVGNFGTVGGGVNAYIDGLYSTVAGGLNCGTNRSYCAIGGGENNIGNGEHVTIGGGRFNISNGQFDTIGGGSNNSTNTLGGSTVGGGVSNVTSNRGATVSGGASNAAVGEYSNIGGGQQNNSGGQFSVVSGGSSNVAINTALCAAIGGGQQNNVAGSYSTIGGGELNVCTGTVSTIGGGRVGNITGNWSTIAGGDTNTITSDYSIICGGTTNTISQVSSFIGGGGSNAINGTNSVIVGGASNTSATGPGSNCNITFIGCGFQNIIASGDNSGSNYSTIVGGFQNTMSISQGSLSEYSFIGGGQVNTISSGVNSSAAFSVITGGRNNVIARVDNSRGVASVVSGGMNNIIANADSATISGGINNMIGNTVFSSNSTISGGDGNIVDGQSNVIGGGSNNSITNGTYHTIPGGHRLTIDAGGKSSFIAGEDALCRHDNTFMWNDSSAPLISTDPNTFVVRARGGTTFLSNPGTTGVTLSSGSSSWASVSDRTKKENIVELDAASVLDKVAALPIYEFNYIGNDPNLICRGPMAQDWHALFPSGKDPLKIDTMDLDGITLAAVKGLIQRVVALEAIVRKYD